MQVGNNISLSGLVSKVNFSDIQTKDLTLRKVEFSLGLKNSYPKKTADGKNMLSWINVEAIGKTAEFFESNYVDGVTKSVELVGEIQQDSWEKDGERKYKVYVKAERLEASEKKIHYGDSPAKSSESSNDDDFSLDDDELPPF